MTKFELTEQEAIKLGSYLKNKREELGYSTNYIEMYTGINKADISRIENGKKKKINPFYLKELANILKLNQIELFNIAGYIENSKFKETKIQSLAIALKLLRESRGITQIQLAEKAGVGSGTIGEIESGKRRCTIKTLDKISKALNLTKEERTRLDNAFMGRDISLSLDSRVNKLNSREKNQYDKTMEEATLFFNDENISEEDKQKLLMAMNEMFFISKQINKEKYAKKTDKNKK